MTTPQEKIAVFETKFTKGEGCWIWQGGLEAGGYGAFYYKGGAEKAHRFSYHIYKGEIPKGLCLDHLCRNRPCVNPDHLEPVTLGENCRRGAISRQHIKVTKCKRGHKFEGDNIIKIKTGRACRTCALAFTELYKTIRKKEKLKEHDSVAGYYKKYKFPTL